MSESQRRSRENYRRKHRDQINEYHRKWMKEHSDEGKSYNTKYATESTKRKREYEALKLKHPTDVLPLTEEFLKTLPINRRAIYEKVLQTLIAETG